MTDMHGVSRLRAAYSVGGGLLVGAGISALLASRGSPMTGVAAAQIILVIVGAALGCALFLAGARGIVPHATPILLGFGIGLAWVGGIWNWFLYEPSTHPGSNPLYGRRSLQLELVRALLTPLWGVLALGAWTLSGSPTQASKRVATLCLLTYAVLVVWPLPDLYRTWRDYPESYEVPFGLLALGIVIACSLPLVVAFLRVRKLPDAASSPRNDERPRV